MTDIRAKRRGTSAPAYITGAIHIITHNVPFNVKCVPDKRTGKEPYRIGWGRSVGQFNPDLIAIESEETKWLQGRLMEVLAKLDPSGSYEDLTIMLVEQYLATH